MSATNTAFTVFSAIGLVLSLIPLWWHLESRNVGTCMFMIWTALACLVYFVDSIVWSGNAVDWAPVWCDIAVRIQIGVAVAWPACALCIIRHLYHVTTSTTISKSPTEKYYEIVVGLLITVGIPVLEMGLEYVVASHRFTVIEDFGCFAATWNTPLTYVLVWSWPLIISIISACYGFLTIRAFLKRRKQFRELLARHTNLTYSRYWRLVAVASIDFCLTIPLSIKAIVTNAVLCPRPLADWVDIHTQRTLIILVTKELAAEFPGALSAIEFNRWSAVLSAFVFFGLFGFADEAMKNYHLLASVIIKPLEYITSTQSTTTSKSTVESGTRSATGASFPVMIVQTVESKGGSFRDGLSTTTVISEYEPEVLSQFDAEQLGGMNPPGHELLRVPEPVLDPSLGPAPQYPYP